ncbi:TetR family transcriptional regulator [Nonomuraea sp. B19D2]|uniref:TetR family transcriptional regulator n=1 Tax=Nonomuraea sp. B19D2 TaxID=3159561 RepID=UPI0032DB8AC8
MANSGLRERKKAKTRETILREAFRLFREQGYHATTTEQIAEAAEIAPSTFFRYFPTKEDLVTLDSFPPIVEALAIQPPELDPLGALRAAFATAFTSLSDEQINAGRDREVFAATVPDLIAANLRKSPRIIGEISRILADRTGRAPDDPELRNIIGAAFGVVAMVWIQWARDDTMDAPAEVDNALAHLQSGLKV